MLDPRGARLCSTRHLKQGLVASMSGGTAPKIGSFCTWQRCKHLAISNRMTWYQFSWTNPNSLRVIFILKEIACSTTRYRLLWHAEANTVTGSISIGWTSCGGVSMDSFHDLSITQACQPLHGNTTHEQPKFTWEKTQIMYTVKLLQTHENHTVYLKKILITPELWDTSTILKRRKTMAMATGSLLPPPNATSPYTSVRNKNPSRKDMLATKSTKSMKDFATTHSNKPNLSHLHKSSFPTLHIRSAASNTIWVPYAYYINN